MPASVAGTHASRVDHPGRFGLQNRRKAIFLGVGALALAATLLTSVSATRATAGVSGTSHDLSGKGWGSDQICIFCHTPHNAGTAAPLWNHTLTTATFTVYSSQTMNAAPGQPDGYSKLCLSCHDGTVAIDSYGTHAGSNNMTGGEALGTNLTNDHPISFTYDAALATADGGLVTPASTSQVVPGVPLFGGKMQCSSCHNAHDNTKGDFLRLSNSGSALCLKCHVK